MTDSTHTVPAPAGDPTRPRVGVGEAERHDARTGLADLWVLGGLLALTATFGRGFSRIGFDGPSIYITEVALAAAACLAIYRLGPRRCLDAIRERVPLVPLAFFWLTALIAFVEGVRNYGLSGTLEDVGLGEYSLLIPLIAVVASSPERLRLLTRVLVAGLIAGTIVYAINSTSIRIFGAGGQILELQDITFGLYMAMLVGFVGGRFAAFGRAPQALAAAGAMALVFIFLTNARGVWISVVVALAAVAVLGPAGRRVRFGAGAVVAVACAFAMALGIQSLNGPTQIGTEISGAVKGAQSQPGSASDKNETENAEWRLAFWKEIVDRSVDHPVLGVGYGEPIAFTWMGLKYDFRDGDPNAVIDVDGPHNEFLHILYRMGYVGLAALLAVLAIALWRAVRFLRIDGLDAERRSLVLGLIGMLFACAVVASFADALKSPFLGLFFWSSLGLLLAAVTQKAETAGDNAP